MEKTCSACGQQFRPAFVFQIAATADGTKSHFCSLECRLIDLGAWLDEQYRVPGVELSTDSESPGPGAPGGG